MKAVLIDDEYYALQGLKMELEGTGFVEIAGLYEDGPSALEGIRSTRPDIVFLDIEMPGCSGMELFGRILELQSDANIVFVTAFSQYALQAFELHSLDYLVKPVQRARLLNTLSRVKEPVRPAEPRHTLQLTCFKHFSIRYGDQYVNVGWRTKKAEELVAYLACAKGRFVAKEKIAEDLWPGLDGEKSASNLYLAYYYVKKQEAKTGIPIPVVSGRGKMRLCMDRVQCDLTEFDELARQCAAITEQNVDLAERARELYKGCLFEENYYAWAQDLQYRYDAAYDNLCGKLLDYHRRRGDIEKCIALEKTMIL